jgi:DNA-binding LacI/PurR family transcriptional regulator
VGPCAAIPNYWVTFCPMEPGPTRRAGPARRPNMRDVAAAANVSYMTVSRVVNGSPSVAPETRARILNAMQVLGYRRNETARALKTQRVNRVGVVASALTERGPSVLVAALQEAALSNGYEMALVALPEITEAAIQDCVDRLLRWDVDALIFTVTHRRALTLGGLPVVLVEGVVEARPYTAGVAQREGAYAATRHLLDLGHRSVAHLAGPAEWVEASERRAGWIQAHEEVGRPHGVEFAGDWTPASGYAGGVFLRDRQDVTAVFSANDQMALGLLSALRESGRRVPEEISVVGFDDQPEAAYFAPALTTVRQDFGKLATEAMDLVVRAVSCERTPTAPLIPAELILRGSTAAPPSGRRGDAGDAVGQRHG